MAEETEEYDASAPGSLFMLVVREPDIWKVASTKLRMEIAKDWAAIGSPKPTAEDTKRLSTAERTGLHQLLASLTRHAIAHLEIETTRAQSQSGAGSRAGAGRTPSKEMTVDRDANGRLRGVKVFG